MKCSSDTLENEIVSKIREKIILELRTSINIWLSSLHNTSTLTEKLDELHVDDDTALVPDLCLLYTFGSYHLCVHDPDSDIDLLCVAANYAPRHMFFNSFVPILRNNDNIRDLLSLPDAFVPVVKFKMYNVEVDLLYASLNVSNVMDSNVDILSDEVLIGVDAPTVRSLNGYRVSEVMILYVL